MWERGEEPDRHLAMTGPGCTTGPAGSSPAAIRVCQATRHPWLKGDEQEEYQNPGDERMISGDEG